MKLTSVEKKENNQAELVILVEKDEFEAALEKAYRQNVGKINVQGFRKGKAPRKLIEKLYGPEVFYEDAMNISYGAAYDNAVAEAGITPVDHPHLTEFDVSDGAFSFKATVTVKPEVTLKQYMGLEAEKAAVAVADAEVDAEFEKIRERNSRLVSVERETKDGDMIIFDFEGFIDGVPFEGGKAEGYSLKLGSNMFIPGFEEQLIGKKAEEDIEVKVSFPEDYQAKELAGKEAIFQCKIHEIKESVKPEADDEFVKDISEFDTIDQYKADLREQLTKTAQGKADNEFHESLMDKLLENFEADVPAVMYERQLDRTVEDFGYRIQSQGVDLNTYLQMNNMEMSSFRRLFEEQAKRQVNIRLALEKAAEMEKVEISQEEIDEEYKNLVGQTRLEFEQVKQYLPEEQIREDLMIQKMVDLITQAAVVKEKAVGQEGGEEKKAAPAKKAPAKKAKENAADAEEKTEEKKKTTAKAKQEKAE